MGGGGGRESGKWIYNLCTYRSLSLSPSINGPVLPAIIVVALVIIVKGLAHHVIVPILKPVLLLDRAKRAARSPARRVARCATAALLAALLARGARGGCGGPGHPPRRAGGAGPSGLATCSGGARRASPAPAAPAATTFQRGQHVQAGPDRRLAARRARAGSNMASSSRTTTTTRSPAFTLGPRDK